MPDWKFGPATFPFPLDSKSNSRRLVNRGGQPRIIKSEVSLQYVEDFCRVFRSKEPFLGPVSLTVYAYYKDNRRDLDVALLQDCLQASGIIGNDRAIVEVHAYKRLDKKNPRTVFQLAEIKTEETE